LKRADGAAARQAAFADPDAITIAARPFATRLPREIAGRPMRREPY
jgi:hypothetical protein